MIGPALIAAGDLWSLVVPIVFFIIYALNHLLSAKGNRPPAPPRNVVRPNRPNGRHDRRSRKGSRPTR